METKSYTTIDRSGWPSGAWDGEPDKMQWQDEATGLPCLAVRHPRSGHWCGYVGVANGHKFHEVNYNDVDPYPDVHCGLTFSAACQPSETEESGVCHTPGPGEPDHVWWLGFDCAHSGDVAPYEHKMGWEPFGTYKALPFVQHECRKLAAQLVMQ